MGTYMAGRICSAIASEMQAPSSSLWSQFYHFGTYLHMYVVASLLIPKLLSYKPNALHVRYCLAAGPICIPIDRRADTASLTRPS